MARVAQAAVRRDGAQRGQPGRLLPPPRRPHRRDGLADRALACVDNSMALDRPGTTLARVGPAPESTTQATSLHRCRASPSTTALRRSRDLRLSCSARRRPSARRRRSSRSRTRSTSSRSRRPRRPARRRRARPADRRRRWWAARSPTASTAARCCWPARSSCRSPAALPRGALAGDPPVALVFVAGRRCWPAPPRSCTSRARPSSRRSPARSACARRSR